MATAHQIKAYEHLAGASGRHMNFRAPRFAARDLFDGQFPFVVLEGVPHILYDLSRTGMAAIGQPSAEPRPEIGQAVPFALRFGDAVLHEGQAAIARVEETDLGPKLGLRILQAEIDIERVQSRYGEEAMRARLRANLGGDSLRPPPELRLLCADMLNLLRACREVLDGPSASRLTDRDALIEFTLAELVAAWRPLVVEANRALDSLLEQPPLLAAFKRYVERLITPEFMVAPLWQRAYHKPLGHPADYRLALDLDRAPASLDQAYAQLLERFGRDVFQWIVNRNQLLADALNREIASHRASERLQIASLGSGGGEEIRLHLARGRLHRPIALTLIDQDPVALGQAFEAVHPHVLRDPERLSLRCLNASHAQVLEGGELQGLMEGHHVILAPAVLDYLRHRTASQLIDVLYRALAPGGVLLACFLRRHEESPRWASELLCDWSMIHRHKDEVYALTSGLPRARIETKLDRRGDVYLCVIRKPRTER